MLNLRKDNYKLLYDFDVDKTYSIKLGKIKKGQKISILSDTMLKAMFQNSNRIKYSVKFLSYFLDISYDELLKNIHLGKNELDKEKESEKGQRCDYVAVIDNTSLNIEVNNNSNKEVMERNMEYAHRLYAKKIKRGEKEYDYTQVIQFNLNNFSFKGNDKIVDIYTIQNNEGIRLNNKLIFVQIYVPNLRKKWYNEGIESLSDEEKYILSLVEVEMDNLKELGDDIIMNEYIEEAEEVSFEEGLGEAYDKEWALKDEGKREGSCDKAKEIAKNMLKDNLDIETIAKYTDLSIEEIKSL